MYALQDVGVLVARWAAPTCIDVGDDGDVLQIRRRRRRQRQRMMTPRRAGLPADRWPPTYIIYLGVINTYD